MPHHANADNHSNWYDALLRIPSDAKALLNGFVAAQQERIGRGTLSGFLDWLTMGAVSGLYEGLKTRTDAMTKDPSLYNIVNWLTLGTADMVKGAFSPDEPLSLEHWLNSLGVASIAVSAYELAQSISQPTFRAIQESPSTPNAPERAVKRPTWRQTELDGVTDYPDHLPQQSFLHGEVVPFVYIFHFLILLYRFYCFQIQICCTIIAFKLYHKTVNNSTVIWEYIRKVRTVFCPDFLAQS